MYSTFGGESLVLVVQVDLFRDIYELFEFGLHGFEILRRVSKLMETGSVFNK